MSDDEAAAQLIRKVGNLPDDLSSEAIRSFSDLPPEIKRHVEWSKQRVLGKLKDKVQTLLKRRKAPPLEAAKVAIRDYGDAVLLHYGEYFVRLDPPFPNPWVSGSRTAREFVERHGFPPAWAAPSEIQERMAILQSKNRLNNTSSPKSDPENPDANEDRPANILLRKIGKENLLEGLPTDIRNRLERTNATALEAAEAAIDKFGNAVLLRYQQHLTQLDPPFPDPWVSKSPSACQFVERHGFPRAWAAPNSIEEFVARHLPSDVPAPELEEARSARILLRKVGGKENLLAKLPARVRSPLEEAGASSTDIAKAAIREFGNAVLLHYYEYLRDLDPPFPIPWISGSRAAREFVARHGFPSGWATPNSIEERLAPRPVSRRSERPVDPGPARENPNASDNQPADILLNKVGNGSERTGASRLLGGLPVLVRTHLGPRATGREVAEAAIAVFQNDVLPRYRKYLARLDPPFPGKWHTGCHSAVEFVRAHGFPLEWAGDRAERTSSYFDVPGPYILPPLHNYQKRIVGNVRRFLSFDFPKWRAMVSLPTGSGKTRIAIQGIVEEIRDGSFDGDILWIVDRKELGEQAVTAWRQIWSGIGPDTNLRITKMWASQTQELMPADGCHVVIATIQTLGRREPWFDDVASFGLVVCDEAHGSISRTYTGVLGDLNLTPRARQEDDHRKLLGLTATPYRSDEARTQRLVSRYGRLRLDKSVFPSDDPEQVVRYLQTHGVLSVADFGEIEGKDYRLSARDRARMETEPWLPSSVEKKIADSRSRTDRIINHFTGNAESVFPALIFATSVDHAYALAYFLSLKGVQAHAIEANTRPATRRKLVDKFRGGEVKVLVNHSLLREGFDAPQTRTILVARPVYSPNLYFQMIGRGLRGPRNGGTERCKIVNVRDNIENFERRLAFDELEWLWEFGASESHDIPRSVPPRAISAYAEKKGFSWGQGYFEHQDGRTLRPNLVNDFSWELVGGSGDPEYFFPVDVGPGDDQDFDLDSAVGGLPRNHTVLLHVLPHGPLIAFRGKGFSVG